MLRPLTPRLAALAAGALATFALALPAAGAVTMTAPAAGAYQTDDMPSCSLHPNFLGDGLVSFTKDPTKDLGNDRWLQVFATDALGAPLLFNDALSPGETTPALRINDAALIVWAGAATYHLGRYHDEHDCDEGEPSTTTTEPAPTTTTQLPPPPTTITVPEPTTTTTAPTTTTTGPPESSTTSAPPTVSTFTPTPTTPGSAVALQRVGVEAAGLDRITSSRTAPLPTTGGTPWPLIGTGLALMALGIQTVRRTRRRIA